ncbi:unnamed protein product [Bursaphelenchus xylophilus]|uniref:(pine wood nematode) hypothetical protein n=1 Tax=Bursaphelenchus xylophilus TaxID=6326 RepID=A0A1I7SDI4_BURXY|nr:unnamed protein product [Bursaphelenchus xylophilus]CAG9131650.1 unnamed protein product [Bursaphelenchus xylophilus]
MRLKTPHFAGSQFLIFLLIATFVDGVSAICPTRFYAQAVSSRRASELDYYVSRGEINSAADCAIFCARRQFCRTAIYNHDTKTCALTYEKLVECSTRKQRYTTFHLTSDGQDGATSMISCVDLCQKESGRFGRVVAPKAAFSTNEDGQVVEKSAENTSTISQRDAQAVSSENSADSAEKTAENSKIVRKSEKKEENSEETPKISQNSNEKSVTKSAKITVEPRGRSIEDSEATVFSESSKPAIIQGKDAQNLAKSLFGPEARITEIDGERKEPSRLIMNALRNLMEETERNHSKVMENGGENSVKVGNMIAVKENAGKKRNITSLKEIITEPIPGHKVTFHASPIQIEETVNGSTSATEAEERSSEIESAVATMKNMTEKSRKDGGFFTWLKPGEKLKFPDGVNVPIELATIAPELFEKSTEKKTFQKSAKVAVHSPFNHSPAQPRDEIRELFETNIDQVIINGRLLTPDEARQLLERERTTTTTTTPLPPWKPASHLFGATEEEDAEKMAVDEARQLVDELHHKDPENGFLNTFFIRGLNNVIRGEEEQRLQDLQPRPSQSDPIDQTHISKRVKSNFLDIATTVTPFPITSTRAPIVCYRSITQQVLMYASFASYDGVSLNQCRCLCADTWRDESEDAIRCKSVQYNGLKGECTLNSGDHNGKFDLIYNKFVDYHYISCEIKYLLQTAKKICRNKSHNVVVNKIPSKSDDTDLDHRHNDEAATISPISTKSPEGSSRKPSLITAAEVAEDTTTEAVEYTTEVTVKPEIISIITSTEPTELPSTTEVAKKKSKTMTIKPEAVEITVDKADVNTSNKTGKKQREHVVKGKVGESGTATVQEITENSTTDRKSTKQPKAKSTVTTTESTTTTEEIVEDSTLEETTSPKLSSTTITTKKPTSTTTFSAISNENEVEIESLEVRSTTEKVVATSAKEITDAFITETLELTTTSSLLDKSETDGCFELIRGYGMNSTAGGLERDVSLEQCECHCANSLASKRYPFQCISATYYAKERDCVLNLDNRQLRPNSLVKYGDDVTYLGLLCPQQRALRRHTDQGSCESIDSTTLQPPTTLQAVDRAHHLVDKFTDDCFLEMPNHVLEGTSLAVEADVSVDECKCFCVDSENRYGITCQSFVYYFDSKTCLLSKENRVSDPQHFNFDPQLKLVHSYFEYRCHAEPATQKTFVQNVCRRFIDVEMSLQPTSSSIDVEEVEHIKDSTLDKHVDHDKHEKHDHEAKKKVKILHFVNEETINELEPHFDVENAEKGENFKESSEAKEPRKHHKPKQISNKTPKITTTEEPTTTTIATTTSTTPKPVRSTKRQLIAELEEQEEDEISKIIQQDDHIRRADASTTTTTTTTTTEAPTTTSTPAPTTTRPTPSSTFSTTPPPSTTTISTTTQKVYPPVGQCRYSALYQTVFNGERTIKKVMVTSPAQCFAACHYERCRSANLIQMEGPIKYCELFRDSIIDFRRTDVLGFDRGAVHFDSIQCDDA